MAPLGKVVIATRIRDGVLIAYVTGDVDRLGAPTMAALVHECVTAHQDFVLDLRGLGFLGTAGLAVLLRMVPAAAESGVSWALVARGPVVTHVIEVTGLNSVLPAHSNLLLALREVAGQRRDRTR